MNRSDLIGIERERTQRRITAPFELRQDSQSGSLLFRGVASTTETPYDVYGGPPYGWTETMAAGSFKKTLRENADVAFLINHDGMTLARTKSGTMSLRESKQGLDVTANLDPTMTAARDLYTASKRGDIDEMSFAFRVVKDEWTDADGNPSTPMEGVNRRITEVNLNKGDVSAVNYGANPTTSGGFREMELALAELRDGRQPSEEHIEKIRQLARLLDIEEEERGEVQEETQEVAPADGIQLGEMTETLALARARWELRNPANDAV